MKAAKRSHHIGTLGEKSLHAALKAWYRRPGDRLEARVDSFHIDLRRRGRLIEIQTGGFSNIKRKLTALVEKHAVRLVYPIAQEKWLVRLAADGATVLGRRKSPKRGRLLHLFRELVSFPQLLAHQNFSLEVLLIQSEEVWCDDGRGAWRRKRWSLRDHRLIGVLSRQLFRSPSDFRALLPPELPEPFTNAELAEALQQPDRVAQQMTYCLRQMGAVALVGKRGNYLLYSKQKPRRK